MNEQPISKQSMMQQTAPFTDKQIGISGFSNEAAAATTTNLGEMVKNVVSTEKTLEQQKILAEQKRAMDAETEDTDMGQADEVDTFADYEPRK